MDYKRGFKRIFSCISIITFCASMVISFVYFHNETKKELPGRLEILNNYRSLLEEKETILSDKSKLSEIDKENKERGLLSTNEFVAYLRENIPIFEKLISPKVYFYNSIWAFSISLGVFISIWIAYYILRCSLIRIINPLIKWLVHGFADKNPRDGTMTREKIAEYRNKLCCIVLNTSADGRLEELKDLAKKVGAGFVHTQIVCSDTTKEGTSTTTNIRQNPISELELVQSISNALQTETMIDMCRIANRNFWISIWLAIAAFLSALAAWAAIIKM